MNYHLEQFGRCTLRPLGLLALLLLVTSVASAQIALRLTSDKQRYLRFEPVVLTLGVTNISGNTLDFTGSTRDRMGSIGFRVERTSGRHARQFGSIVNPTQGLKLAPGESRELQITINQFFDMQNEDSYTIRAQLEHGRINRIHISDEIRLEIHDGTPIAKRNIGLPAKNYTDVIKSLEISLLRFTDLDEDIYCLRAEDDENVYAVYRLGAFIDGEKPQMELDDSSLLHLLLQIRPRLFTYYIFGFEGRNMRLLQKRFYVSADGAPPTLTRASGYLRIAHARLAREGVDYVEADGPLDPKSPVGRGESRVPSRLVSPAKRR